MNDNQILFARQNDICFFKFIGEVRYTASGGLDRLIDKLFQDPGQCRDAVVDLREASYLDSTNLGLLAMIARKLITAHDRKPTLLSTNQEVNRILQSMCLDQVFILLDQPEKLGQPLQQWQQIEPDDRDRAKMLLTAHEALLELGEQNRQTFQPVVDMMRQELAGQQKP